MLAEGRRQRDDRRVARKDGQERRESHLPRTGRLHRMCQWASPQPVPAVIQRAERVKAKAVLLWYALAHNLMRTVALRAQRNALDPVPA